MDLSNMKIQALVDLFTKNELLLPEMQRKYVWKAKQARDLLDSLYRDYPSGSILLWEADTDPVAKTPTFGGNEKGIFTKKMYLLDGQQRLTSLTSILTGRPIRIKEGVDIKEKAVEIYFNIDHPENLFNEIEDDKFEVGDNVYGKWTDDNFYIGRILAIQDNKYLVKFEDGDLDFVDVVESLDENEKKELWFQIKNKTIIGNKHWISVTRLFTKGVGTILQDLKIGYDNKNFEKFNQRLNHLYSIKENYIYPVQIIRNKSYKEVTQIFSRVNSAGSTLKGTDLALAQVTSIWPGSINIFEQFVDACAKQGFYLSENFFVRCIVSIATNQVKFDSLSKLSLPKLQQNWELAKIGIQNTINFLKNNSYIESSYILPSDSLLIPLICYSAKKELSATKEVERGFLYWFYNAAIWARYSSSSESKLSADLSFLTQSEKPWLNMIENIWQQVGPNRIVNVTDIRGKNVSSPFFFMMYLLARSKDARDLENGKVVNFSNFGRNNSIEYDHIFPKSKLELYFKNKDKNELKKIVNEIANIGFMSKKGNIIKSNDDPSVYLPKVNLQFKNEDYLSRQEIPIDSDLYSYDRYLDFLDERAKNIANSLNSFIMNYK